jgi:hypothetical protein
MNGRGLSAAGAKPTVCKKTEIEPCEPAGSRFTNVHQRVVPVWDCNPSGAVKNFKISPHGKKRALERPLHRCALAARN